MRIPELFDLSQRVVWIPGGGGYLGAVISRGLAELGARVVVGGRPGGSWATVAETLSAEELDCSGLAVDVSDESSVKASLDSILEMHGQLDACVNLAAFSTGAPYSTMTVEEWSEGLRVTGTGSFIVGRACGEIMKPGGSIVHFSSMYGQVSPDPRAYPSGVSVNPPDYGFAKAGIEQLVRYQAVALAPLGIRVNAVAPGPFPSPRAQQNGAFIRNLEQRVPLARVGRPSELLGPVALLCSNASSYMTGTTIQVDGGWTAW